MNKKYEKNQIRYENFVLSFVSICHILYVVACGSRSGDQAVFSKIIRGNDAAKYPWNAAIWIDEG